jgi:hypothetical protein
MIMTAVAKAVYRGSDGSVHYLSSSPDHSLLIITDPVLGVELIEFDGPAQLTSHPKSDVWGTSRFLLRRRRRLPSVLVSHR